MSTPPTDTTPDLATRLVQAGTEALPIEIHNPRDAAAVLAAALRTLRDYCEEEIQESLAGGRTWEPLGPSDFDTWANQIEETYRA